MRLSELIKHLQTLENETDKEVLVHSPEGFMDVISVWSDPTAPANIVEIEWKEDNIEDHCTKIELGSEAV